MISRDNRELAGMQAKQLEMLHELDRVCRLCRARYYLSSGTCLGAVRHQGFIPWDDDIDVYMTWEDAGKLERNRNLFQKHYFLQNKKTDPNVKTAHYRLRDSSTSMFLKEDYNVEINHGIFIDIYILYPYPDNRIRAQKLIFDSFIYRILIAGSGPVNHGRLAFLAGRAVLCLYKGRRAVRKIKRIERDFRCNGGKRYYATYFGRDVSLFRSIIYPREWFERPRMLKFEDMVVPCPADTEAYCRLQYGKTYMELPPEEKRIPHHDYIFASVDEPFTKLKGIYY